ncbi:hypothetical protein [Nonomuraea typhae]|uniref:Nuclear transport factor 2 family protein n=1 Tax=Nonomuraea typhae TaxID=2603600 RepID=A0ABW7Z0G8_9ACTN
MAHIITELLDDTEISHYLDGVVDSAAIRTVHELLPDAGGWIGTKDNAIAIEEGMSERCLLKYELWDAHPPLLRSWDRTWDGSLRLTSGKVFAVSGYSGEEFYGQEFNLGRRDGIWNLRVYRKALGHEEFTPQLVSFTLLKLQFWPGWRMT